VDNLTRDLLTVEEEDRLYQEQLEEEMAHRKCVMMKKVKKEKFKVRRQNNA